MAAKPFFPWTLRGDFKQAVQNGALESRAAATDWIFRARFLPASSIPWDPALEGDPLLLDRS